MTFGGRALIAIVCAAVVSTAAACSSSGKDHLDDAASVGTASLDGLMALAGRPCVVVDVGKTANCGTLHLQHGYSSAAWLTVLSRDSASAGLLVSYGEDWAAWGTADDVRPYAEAGGTLQQL